MNTSIGVKIKALRMQSHMSQEELCGKYMSRVVLSRIENGKSLPSLPHIEYISKKFNKSIDFFLYDQDVHYEGAIEYGGDSSILGDMYQKGNFNSIVKLSQDDTAQRMFKTDFNSDYYIGMAYFNLNIYYEAIKPLRRYINRYLKTSGDVHKRNSTDFIISLNTMFKIMLENKNYSKCESYLNIAKKYAYINSIDGSYMGYVIHNNLSYIYLKQLRYEDIIRLLEAFMDSHRDAVYLDVAASMCLSLNVSYYNIGDYENAIKYVKKAINLYSYIENFEDTGIGYLNYINALRYSSKFDEAYSILNACLYEYNDCDDLYQRFLMQKLILEFNRGDNTEAIKTAGVIEINRLSKRSKCDYYFITGHLEFLYHDYKKAHEHLLRCRELYMQNKYCHELFLLYKDLYEITGDKVYEEKAAECRSTPVIRKNILV